MWNDVNIYIYIMDVHSSHEYIYTPSWSWLDIPHIFPISRWCVCVCVCVCTQPQVGHQKSRDLLQPNFSCFHVRSMSCQHLWFQKNILMNFKVHFAEAHSAQHSGDSSARIHRASRTSSVTKKLSLLLCPFIQYIGHHRSVWKYIPQTENLWVLYVFMAFPIQTLTLTTFFCIPVQMAFWFGVFGTSGVGRGLGGFGVGVSTFMVTCRHWECYAANNVMLSTFWTLRCRGFSYGKHLNSIEGFLKWW